MTRRTMSSWPLILACFLALGHFVRGQDEAPVPKSAVPWEYKTVPWASADTEAALRAATGDGTGTVVTMLSALADVSIPRQHPAMQRAVDARIGERLAELGKDGWELVWIRDGTTIAADRYELSAPTLILKRRGP